MFKGMAVLAGVTIWVSEMIVIAALAAHRTGARLAFLTAGLLLPVPAFVAGAPIQRGLLAFAFEISLVRAAQLALSPLPGSFGARLVYLGSFVAFVDTRAASRSGRRFDVRLAAKIVLSAAIAIVSIVVWSLSSNLPLWLRYAARCSAGAVLIFAAAEITDAFIRFPAALGGVTLPPLHDEPYRSRSLSEFWGKRWNVAAATALRTLFFTPLAHRNPTLALFATFAASAALHAYIAGVALGRRPALMWAGFFLVQALLITIERTLRVQRWPRPAGWMWTVCTLALTSPLLILPFLNFFKITM